MAETPRQLPLILPHEAALGSDDYLVGKSNQAAFQLLEGWPDWPAPVVVLAGPVGAGKTHLVEAFVAETGAVAISADDLGNEDVAALSTVGASSSRTRIGGIDDTALFHLLNAARQADAKVLITSRTWPAPGGSSCRICPRGSGLPRRWKSRSRTTTCCAEFW
jgi:chromosomal replication initiation ATPase DnaA